MSTAAALSLRGHLGRFLAVLGGVIALAVIAVTASLLSSASAQERVTDTLEPARVAFRDLYTSLLDQESGVVAFALTAEPSYLELYETGRNVAVAQEELLAGLLPGEPGLRAALDDLLAAHERWHTEAAEPLIADARAGQPVDLVLFELAHADFAQVRTTFTDLIRASRAERARAEASIGSSRRLLVASLLVTLAALVGAAVVLWAGLRRRVVQPLAALGEATRRVRAGDLDLVVAAHGPAELERLASDVNDMRMQLAADLERIEAVVADLEASNAELEQFAYVASHDLQEPLRKVTAFCQLLQKRYGGQLDERADEYIDFAVDGALRMQALISDLLDFSRVGRVDRALTDVDLAEVAQVALTNLSAAIEDAGATVEVGELPVAVGDRGLLISLYQNLVANSVKFCRPGHPPRVELGARPTDEGWELWCRDDGIGIEPRFADRVFQVFQRLHGREVYAGTGIGLALCRKIVVHHGGTIWVDTDGGGPGTTIRWTLPAGA